MRFIAILICLVLAGCSAELTQQSVSEFVEQADEAFLGGRAADVCDMRAKTFRMEATEFRLTEEIVPDFAAAEAKAAARFEVGERSQRKRVVLDLREYCSVAYEARSFYKRASMQRGPLDITIDPAKQQAVVRAHYTIWEPVYGYGDSPLNARDQVETQTATKQTESDDESVIVIEDGKLKFASTKSVSKSFHVASHRDRRL